MRRPALHACGKRADRFSLPVLAERSWTFPHLLFSNCRHAQFPADSLKTTRYSAPMRDNRLGGLALIIGMVANIITMALHPTGHDLLNSPSGFQLQAALARGVHFLALVSFPVLFLGALALSRYLNSPSRLSVIALAFYALALIAGIMAVIFSGFLGPGLAKHLIDPADPNKKTFEILFAYNFAINQAFARILASASSLSIVLWSL